MYIVLCTAPTEPVHIVPPPNVRAMGELPVLPKYAIVSLVKWMEKNGYTAEDYDFYDIDMLLPSQEEILEYFRRTKPDVVGLSAVTSGTYSQIKRLARTIRSVCPDALIVLGGNLSASVTALPGINPNSFTRARVRGCSGRMTGRCSASVASAARIAASCARSSTLDGR